MAWTTPWIAVRSAKKVGQGMHAPFADQFDFSFPLHSATYLVLVALTGMVCVHSVMIGKAWFWTLSGIADVTTANKGRLQFSGKRATAGHNETTN